MTMDLFKLNNEVEAKLVDEFENKDNIMFPSLMKRVILNVRLKRKRPLA